MDNIDHNSTSQAIEINSLHPPNQLTEAIVKKKKQLMKNPFNGNESNSINFHRYYVSLKNFLIYAPFSADPSLLAGV